MKIAVGQIDCQPGLPGENTRKLCDWVHRAARQGSDMVIFPEMADTGYDPSLLAASASSWDRGPVPALQAAAAQAGIFVVCGLSEREENAVYNSLAVISPSGNIIGSYRKAHLITPPPFVEDRCFTAGSRLLLMDIGQWRWGFTICYDLRFPELFRALALSGANVLVNCAAFPAGRDMNWDVLTRARAIENQVFLVAANRVGTDGPCQFCGLSRVVAPDGTLTGSAGREEELLTASIDPGPIDAVRRQIPVCEARRPDIYGNLKTAAPRLSKGAPS